MPARLARISRGQHATMPAPEQVLLAFFQRVARREPAQLQCLERHPGFVLESERWCFKLPDLYIYLQRHEPGFHDVDYRRFRGLLFGCPVNRTIALLGAQVIIADNRRKVDRSTYALVWNPPAGAGSLED